MRLSKVKYAKNQLGKLTLPEYFLLAFSYHPQKQLNKGSYTEPSAQWTLDSALDTLVRSFPNLVEKIQNKRVLDYGSGDGFQSIALANAGAECVQGVEIEEKRVKHAKKLADSLNCESVDFRTKIDGSFDFVISLNAMEHFVKPEENLCEIHGALKIGGQALISFGPPWYAPYGNHMYFFSALPWMNILFSEKTVMRIRSLYRADSMDKYEPELNRMSISRFEKLINASDFEMEALKYNSIKGIPFISKIPILRELFINQVDIILIKQ